MFKKISLGRRIAAILVIVFVFGAIASFAVSAAGGDSASSDATAAVSEVAATAATDPVEATDAPEVAVTDGEKDDSVMTTGTADDADAEADDSDGDATAAAEETATTGEVEKEEDVLLKSTFWSLLPAVVAIVLALITKEVYSSLFVGILSGGVLYAIGKNGFSFEKMFNSVAKNGFINNLADTWNVGILVFLVMLGAVVAMMNRAGGSRAYGEWASKKIKTRRGAMLSSFGLGALIFVDDYFNCLTVGSVMRPVTDKEHISRAKLAYIIDATAAPICIIAPISSWAAAVSGCTEGVNGFTLFLKTIPLNLYAILTIIMVVIISAAKFDYGPMKKHEKNAVENNDLFTSNANLYANTNEEPVTTRGKVIDLVLPVIILIAFCIVGMLYTGGLFSGTNFIDAFANCDAAYGLALGSIASFIAIVVYMIARRVLSFRDCMNSLTEGFRAMVPAILILTFAWALKAMTNLLGADTFVAGLVESSTGLIHILPALLFLVALGLSFATGTSWGTFGILIPIVQGVFPASYSGEMSQAFVICVAACLAGAVCGDHCSPISDTTIMASTGAQCDHVNHVSTQLPYALTVAAVCFAGYLLAGFVENTWIILGASAALMIVTLLVIKLITNRKRA